MNRIEGRTEEIRAVIIDDGGRRVQHWVRTTRFKWYSNRSSSSLLVLHTLHSFSKCTVCPLCLKCMLHYRLLRGRWIKCHCSRPKKCKSIELQSINQSINRNGRWAWKWSDNLCRAESEVDEWVSEFQVQLKGEDVRMKHLLPPSSSSSFVPPVPPRPPFFAYQMRLNRL